MAEVFRLGVDLLTGLAMVPGPAGGTAADEGAGPVLTHTAVLTPGHHTLVHV